MTITRWLFADQLGPHFRDDPDQPILLILSRRALGRKRYHRAKQHLIVSALRHAAAHDERVTLLEADTYGEALDRISGPIEVVHPTSRAALRFVEARGLDILPPRGFVTGREEFEVWAADGRLRLEDFYREVRRRTGIMMVDGQPEGGRWNLDAENRSPPPKGAERLDVTEPWWPVEDEIDRQARADLDRWGLPCVGRDAPRRFAVTPAEADLAAGHFLRHRLVDFGPYEDAVLAGDPWMAHSLLSVPLNLGLLDPLDLARRAAESTAPIASREGFVRQIIGWRDYIWHLYWHLGPEYIDSNALGATTALPSWFADLAADEVDAACVAGALGHVRDHGWAHHIERLMILGSWALQRGYHPRAVSDWFQAGFVDGYEWVMLPNAIGMSQFADGGVVATKPYTSAGAYLNRMTDHCAGCRYRPGDRVGDRACPFTTGYWAFLDRHAEDLRGNHRMGRPLASMRRLADLPAVLARDAEWGDGPP